MVGCLRSVGRAEERLAGRDGAAEPAYLGPLRARRMRAAEVARQLDVEGGAPHEERDLETRQRGLRPGHCAIASEESMARSSLRSSK